MTRKTTGLTTGPGKKLFVKKLGVPRFFFPALWFFKKNRFLIFKTRLLGDTMFGKKTKAALVDAVNGSEKEHIALSPKDEEELITLIKEIFPGEKPPPYKDNKVLYIVLHKTLAMADDTTNSMTCRLEALKKVFQMFELEWPKSKWLQTPRRLFDIAKIELLPSLVHYHRAQEYIERIDQATPTQHELENTKNEYCLYMNKKESFESFSWCPNIKCVLDVIHSADMRKPFVKDSCTCIHFQQRQKIIEQDIAYKKREAAEDLLRVDKANNDAKKARLEADLAEAKYRMEVQLAEAEHSAAMEKITSFLTQSTRQNWLRKEGESPVPRQKYYGTPPAECTSKGAIRHQKGLVD